MSDEMNNTFTSEQILNQAQGNATAISLATIAYLRDNHLDVNGYCLYVGERLASGWAGMQGQGVQDVVQAAALNMISVGATLQSLSGNDAQAEAVIAGWPPEADLAFFGLDYSDFEPFWNVFQPIAASLGFQYAWKRQGDVVTITFSH